MPQTEKPAIAVIGAGLIGRRHIGLVVDRARLAAVVDPDPSAAALAETNGAPWFADIHDALDAARPDGVIVATPNHLHLDHGLACLDAGIPVLVEKPLADRADAARHLRDRAEKTGVPLLVGHHRRHGGAVKAAKAQIAQGALGRVVAVNAQFWLYKPDDYFQAAWRRQPGAGPTYINLIHDIDLMRHLCGEIVAVQAVEANAVRGHAVEDTSAIILEFAGGALGTVAVSDTAVAPWSWEMTSGENPMYPETGQSAYAIAGTHASLSLPDLHLWRHDGARSWTSPIAATRIDHDRPDPVAAQLDHFIDVIAGRAVPLVTAEEGLRNITVLDAIKRAAATGARQAIGGKGAARED